uniref:Uncharacterized protein n=1 Tax=Corethron hystrix TaxID=216773 RepID=A0A7S1G0F6_9STRA|mmetsp:Transcript_4472/g.8705  ORF Transcript_4472/g.8705 Transcript_4472/m.8705 type:complete len:111 (+) Transcript_4472:60-392(+)
MTQSIKLTCTFIHPSSILFFPLLSFNLLQIRWDSHHFVKKIELLLLFAVALAAFASYHPSTGSTVWLQWTTLGVLIAFSYVFDASFSDESNFVFDPDADNWRRRTEAGQY